MVRRVVLLVAHLRRAVEYCSGRRIGDVETIPFIHTGQGNVFVEGYLRLRDPFAVVIADNVVLLKSLRAEETCKENTLKLFYFKI